MPPSEGYRYCLTCIDRFSRWPEVFPIQNQDAETIARAFFEGWICRFGCPSKIVTDQGRQFESHLFRSLNCILGTKHLRTTPYHPQSNGMIERFHRQLKDAVRCHSNIQWTQVLPSVLLGIRAAWKEDLQTTSAELVYGEQIRLPGEFLLECSEHNDNPLAFIRNLKENFKNLQPLPIKRHSQQKPFIFKDLMSTSHVFVRHDGVKPPLRMPFDGPFEVLQRNEKFFQIKINGKPTNVSIDRLKPAFMVNDIQIFDSVSSEQKQQIKKRVEFKL